MRIAFVVLAGAFAAACATPAPTAPAAVQAAAAPAAAPAAPAAPKAVAAKGEKKTCKRTTAIGSNVPKSVCRTEAEWAAMDKQGREDVEEFDRARRELTTTGIGQ